MIEEAFDVLDYLSGLTNYVFDKAVLKRVAARRNILYAESYGDIDEETEKLCTKDLLITVLRGPWSTASRTRKHGTFEEVTGQQTITANALEEIKSQIRQLNNELGITQDDGIPNASTNEWVNERDW